MCLIRRYVNLYKTIQWARPPNHHDGFVSTCQLWTAIGGARSCGVAELNYIYTQVVYIQCISSKFYLLLD